MNLNVLDELKSMELTLALVSSPGSGDNIMSTEFVGLLSRTTVKVASSVELPSVAMLSVTDTVTPGDLITSPLRRNFKLEGIILACHCPVILVNLVFLPALKI